MTIRSLEKQNPFTTADGSQIRSLLDHTNAAVQHQSLAEATLTKHQSTQRHYHQRSEEFYFILEGEALMEIDGEKADVRAGDAILIPPKAWHQITAKSECVRFLCCCAPPYAHEDCYFS